MEENEMVEKVDPAAQGVEHIKAFQRRGGVISVIQG